MTNEKGENGELLHPGKRIMLLGRFIHRFSIDELAGLFNISNGTMSIIGSRPLVVDCLPLYNERHRCRHTVRLILACWDLRKSSKLTAESLAWIPGSKVTSIMWKLSAFG
ncbi:MAG: sugar transferase [Ruminococcaceae bacterium]|nr:sugar transferase [Oscillospiraceae bacterium]